MGIFGLLWTRFKSALGCVTLRYVNPTSFDPLSAVPLLRLEHAHVALSRWGGLANSEEVLGYFALRVYRTPFLFSDVPHGTHCAVPSVGMAT